jgi:hypothetical protein
MIADAGRHELVVTIEDGIRVGGAGSLIIDAIADLQETRRSPPVLTLGVPASYIPHGKADAILSQLGLDGPGIAAATAKALPGRDDLDGPHPAVGLTGPSRRSLVLGSQRGERSVGRPQSSGGASPRWSIMRSARTSGAVSGTQWETPWSTSRR